MVRAAARKLNIAPSAISRQLRYLEEELGEKLLEKASLWLHESEFRLRRTHRKKAAIAVIRAAYEGTWKKT